MEAAVKELAEKVEVTGLSQDQGGQISDVDQATFFRTVNESNVNTLQALLKNRKIDVNMYNKQGVTALHLAVYKFEETRNVEIAKILLQNGANVGLRALTAGEKLSIQKKDARADTRMEAKKVLLDRKMPLLLALELKSTLYVRGWEYRHWDQLLEVLSKATVQLYAPSQASPRFAPPGVIPESISAGWQSVFDSGKHDLVEVWSEGKHIKVLKMMLATSSKVWKSQLDANPSRVEVKEASHTITRAMMEFLYTGRVEPQFMETRGIDLYVAAYKYGLEDLKKICEAGIKVTPDNWIKVLTAATEAGSDVLTVRVAHDISSIMEQRIDAMSYLKKSYSDRLEESETPGQVLGIFGSLSSGGSSKK